MENINANECAGHSPMYMVTWEGGGDMQVSVTDFAEMMGADYRNTDDSWDWERIEFDHAQLRSVLALEPLQTFVWDNLTQRMSITRLADYDTALKVGDRVRILKSHHVVTNYEIAVEGLLGTVTDVPDDGYGIAAVKLDQHFDDLGEWDNRIIWNLGDEPSDMTFYNDIERVYIPAPAAVSTSNGEEGVDYITITVSPEVRRVLREVLGIDQ